MFLIAMGLTLFAVSRMVDLSHTSEAVMHAVLETTLAPAIFSHSSA